VRGLEKFTCVVKTLGHPGQTLSNRLKPEAAAELHEITGKVINAEQMERSPEGRTSKDEDGARHRTIWRIARQCRVRNVRVSASRHYQARGSQFGNRKRLHLSLGYPSPMAFEKQQETLAA
jgi:hypothetical protein